MSLDLERQLTFYGAFHHNPVNIAIHIICVPLILLSGWAMAANTGTLLTLPEWVSVANLPVNGCTLGAITWGGLYVLLEPVAGTVFAAILLGGAAMSNHLFAIDPTMTTQVAAGVHIVCWIAQFIGHGKFEGRAPALTKSILQAIFLAPMFVWLELLFMLGYRAELRARVEKAVQVEIAKFRESKSKAAGKIDKLQ